ncbi:MAG: hypothetical protein WBF39_17625, partial [Planococcus donghaensis]
MKTEQQNVNKQQRSRKTARAKFTDQRYADQSESCVFGRRYASSIEQSTLLYNGEFDPGSGRTLA